MQPTLKQAEGIVRAYWQKVPTFKEFLDRLKGGTKVCCVCGGPLTQYSIESRLYNFKTGDFDDDSGNHWFCSQCDLS